ncbi:hypothetical protein UlMin_009858 [Ulmus minor]
MFFCSSIASGQEVPFKVGEEVEARSFLQGYRGAWFRCKIRKFSCRDDQMWCSLKYFDFPDQKLVSTKLYQFPPVHNRKSKKKKLELMIRPRFPPIHCESQMPDANTISEVTVIVNDDWKVGDLVDWWADNNSYWSGRITQILGDDKVQIELHPPPVGEGLSYEVPCKDLRPSLDWSAQHGWTVVTPKGTDGQCCAQILKPVNQGARLSSTADVVTGARASHITPTSASSSQPSDKMGQIKKQPPKGAVEAKEMQSSQKNRADSGQMQKQSPEGAVEEKEMQSSGINMDDSNMKDSGQMEKHPPEAVVEPKEMQSSGANIDPNMADSGQMEKHPPEVALEAKEMPSSGANMDSNMADSGIEKTSCLDSIASSIIKDASSEGDVAMLEKNQHDKRESSKKMRIDEETSSDTTEAAILKVEELLNKIKWMKNLLDIRKPLTKPQWKFVHQVLSPPK